MKKLVLVLLTMIWLGTFVIACDSSSTKNNYKSVDPNEFEQIIKDSTVIILDVRAKTEYAAGHIIGSICLDVNQEDFETQAKELLPKDRTIAIYCRSGRRSKIAAQILVNNGYNVVELDCGINCWISCDKQIEK
ncbi:MAG: rhodanese-like domain-containing protein [Bacteroidales bacterium]|nr:rhodanese-like domain-containing protein [Bacteroidales bacterium]